MSASKTCRHLDHLILLLPQIVSFEKTGQGSFGVNEFAEAIGLSQRWPLEIDNNNSEMSVFGLFVWAQAYFTAAEILHSSEKSIDREFYCGPVMQTVGLATELTLKTILRGWGSNLDEIKKYSHNTYNAYCDARHCFDEFKFISLHISNTRHIPVPEEVKTRLAAQGESNVETRWRVYFDHLRLLDGVYDRPYHSRYITPGPVVLPETEIVLIGTKLLLTAIEERLE